MIKFSSTLIQRLKFVAPWVGRHLIFSIIVAVLVALLVIGNWYPSPFAEISGGVSLFLTLVIVDVICGPLLTLLLIKPGKSRKALLVDIFLIALIQISALAYGIYTFSQGRPIAVVFEVDRFHVISFADIDNSKPEMLPDWVKPWSIEPPRLLGVRGAKGLTEMMESVEASLQGVEPGQRPWMWQEYALSASKIKERAKPLVQLLDMHPELKQRIQDGASKAALDALEHETGNPNELLWLPVVSRKAMDWVAFVDPQSARIRGYVHADGFGELNFNK